MRDSSDLCAVRKKFGNSSRSPHRGSFRLAKIEEMRPRPSLSMLFDMGCGFTEFLSNVFAHLPLPQVGLLFSDLIVSESQIKTIGQVLQCRLVCSTWRDFIDMEVCKPNSFWRQSHNEQDFVETISQCTKDIVETISQ